MNYEIRHYCNANGTNVFGDWLDGLTDQKARANIAARMDRLQLGLFGDSKSLAEAEGVCELRINYGPGYRVYYVMLGTLCVLLLFGGDKRKQSSDIDRALAYLKDYKERSGTP